MCVCVCVCECVCVFRCVCKCRCVFLFVLCFGFCIVLHGFRSSGCSVYVYKRRLVFLVVVVIIRPIIAVLQCAFFPFFVLFFVLLLNVHCDFVSLFATDKAGAHAYTLPKNKWGNEYYIVHGYSPKLLYYAVKCAISQHTQSLRYI